MPVPFKVKALFEYKSEEPDDLVFPDGQIITVTEEEDDDWYTGEYVNGAGQKVEGIFPRNFVEKYEPVIPNRPARAPRRPVQAEAGEAEPAAEPVSSPPPTVQSPKEAQSEFVKETKEPEPAPAQSTAPVEPKPGKQPPPPVAEKPSSFKDRIAAFNKPAAAPVAPFKPQAAGGGSSSFIKKAFVAPPPSRNAYVPPPREDLPQKIYRREEDPDFIRDEEDDKPAPPPPVRSGSTVEEEEEDQPQPTSLKDRIALLQKQQLEQAARQADLAKKKEKPKRPPKPRTESHETAEDLTETPLRRADTGDSHIKQSSDVEHQDEEDALQNQRSREETGPTMPTPLPSRELVSDTNDADDSGAGDTEDAQETSTEEERGKPKPMTSPKVVDRAETKDAPEVDPENDEDDEDDEDEDPEIRRRRELRERMAKMSGGMGMMGMLGGGMPAPAKKPRAPKEEKQVSPPADEETMRAPPVPIMALPGMSTKQKPKELDVESDEDGTAQPTPMGHGQPEEPMDYVSHQPVRRSTDRQVPTSPPLPPGNRPEPPQSPGARPAPPPPPPTRTSGELPLVRDEVDSENLPHPPTSTRPVPPPPPTTQYGVPPPAPPSRSQTASTTDMPSGAPPVPTSQTTPLTRPPPPPPPGQPPSRRSTLDSTSKSRTQEDSEDEVTEYDGDYDTDIASSVKHKDALKSHNRDSSFDEGVLTDDAAKSPQSPPARAVPPVPQSVPRNVPPPPPPAQTAPKTRRSVDAPRMAPPPVPSATSPGEDDEYDPYRYSSLQQSVSGMTSSVRSPTDDTEVDDMYDATPQPSRVPPPPSERAVPPPPPSSDFAESMSMSGALAAPEQRNKQSIDLGRSSTTSRRSGEAPRTSLDQGIIAADLDLAPSSLWWTRDNTPPPSLDGRNDVLWEVESSTSQKRGGKTAVTRDVYVLYQDYSQTTINAKFDPAEPDHVSFEQSHERPPMPPRKDQLEAASDALGVEIAKSAERAVGNIIGEGAAHEFVLSVLRPLQTALMPVGTRSYGALVYANLANASTQQMDEIRPGDIVTFRNAKFAGHKGGLHQKYAMDVGKPEHVGVVIDWDGTKKKIRVWEQGNQDKGKKSKVREESYRVADLKSGEVRVWRVMPRSYVGWS